MIFFSLYVKFMRSVLLVINTFTFQFSENFKSKLRANTIKYLNNTLNKTLKINVPLAGDADNLCGIQRQFRGVRYRRLELYCSRRCDSQISSMQTMKIS